LTSEALQFLNEAIYLKSETHSKSAQD